MRIGRTPGGRQQMLEQLIGSRRTSTCSMILMLSPSTLVILCCAVMISCSTTAWPLM